MNGDEIRFIWEKALARGAKVFGHELRPTIGYAPKIIDVFVLAVHDLVARQPDIFFLQIGAHNGLDKDPIAPLVRQYGWPGLLVEPQAHVFAKLVENYADQPQLRFENAAIAEREGTFTLYAFEGADAQDPASMAASSRRHYLTLNSEGRRGTIKELKVPALTLNGLLDKHGVKKVDILQIDTEGYDFNILKMLDFARIKPQLIHFESNYLNSRQKEECFRRLDEAGYALLTLGIDSIAYQQPNDEAAATRLALSRIVVT